jgi:hypothetical protein
VPVAEIDVGRSTLVVAYVLTIPVAVLMVGSMSLVLEQGDQVHSQPGLSRPH